MTRSIALVAIALALFGCVHATPKPTMGPAPGPWTSPPCPPIDIDNPIPCSGDPAIADSERAACSALGGSIKTVGFFTFACVYPATDAGHTCKDSSECVGACVTLHEAKAGERVAGQCTALVNEGGCNNFVEKGHAIGLLCAD